MNALKKIIPFLVVVFCIFSSNVSPAFAVKVVFPSAARLQPIPLSVYPNISGNINASTGPSYENQQPPTQSVVTNSVYQTQTNNIVQQTASTTETNQSISFWPIVFLSGVVLIVVAVIVFFWLF